MSEEFLDEQILKAKKKQEKFLEAIEHGRDENQINDIILNKSAIINGEEYLFEKRDISNINLLMPHDFDFLEERYVKLKYPSYKNTNHYILSNKETTINIAFDFQNREIEVDEVELARDQILELLLRTHPAATVLDKSHIRTAASLVEVYYLEIITPSLDQPIYNCMFMFELNGKLAVGTFNCFEIEMFDWRLIILQMIESIELIN